MMNSEITVTHLPTSWADVPLLPFCHYLAAQNLNERVVATAAIVGADPEQLVANMRAYSLIEADLAFMKELPQPTDAPSDLVHGGIRYHHIGNLQTITAGQMEALNDFLRAYEEQPILAGPSLLAVLYKPAGLSMQQWSAGPIRPHAHAHACGPAGRRRRLPVSGCGQLLERGFVFRGMSQQNQPTRAVGRPTKLTQAFLEAAKTVLFEDRATIIYTDHELLDAINELLEPQARVEHTTFEKWKAKAAMGQLNVGDGLGEQFIGLYKKALREQKKALMVAFSTDIQWQRWAWILERKFSEWNLRHLSQVDHTTKGESLHKLSDADLDLKIQQLLG